MMNENSPFPFWIALGDSITEGFTYSLWISDSCRAAGLDAPQWINAAAAGNTAGNILQRLESEVIVHSPARVFLNAGINDVQKQEGGSIYEEKMREILRRLNSAGMEVCVITTTAFGPKKASLNSDLVDMNARLRKLAREFDIPVAEVFEPFLEAVKAGAPVLIEDDIHLSFEGYRIMADAILRQINPGIPLSLSWKPEVEAGVPAEWKICPVDGEGTAWSLKVPEEISSQNWWECQESLRGYVMNPRKHFSQASAVRGRTEFFLSETSPVQIRIGATVQDLKIDGDSIELPELATKWGVREVCLREFAAGRHHVEVTAENSFFAAFLSNCSKSLSRFRSKDISERNNDSCFYESP
ncbi:SGNH/GDSL hydrolase family protein [Puniceicoccus vermicola]|uniref:SGNH hydrolase-type esterase domain-containing protein n=1 Tax=Puniceicoccus vermicola TaxID=388746 RepID=A0A7X1B1Q9_9BACT|nr:GDSL-type esterase/lipase family protein [Puniceicoccus vermicola]MBC2602923.1 hypothetical protein [Puniceicoccus vermicola]